MGQDRQGEPTLTAVRRAVENVTGGVAPRSVAGGSSRYLGSEGKTAQDRKRIQKSTWATHPGFLGIGSKTEQEHGVPTFSVVRMVAVSVTGGCAEYGVGWRCGKAAGQWAGEGRWRRTKEPGQDHKKFHRLWEVFRKTWLLESSTIQWFQR